MLISIIFILHITLLRSCWLYRIVVLLLFHILLVPWILEDKLYLANKKSLRRFLRLLHCRRQKFSLRSFILIVKICRWRNYRRFLRLPTHIRQIFVYVTYAIIFYSYIFLTNTFTECVYRYLGYASNLSYFNEIWIIKFFIYYYVYCSR